MGILNFAWGSHISIDRYVKIIGYEPLNWQKAQLSNFTLTANELKSFPPEGADLASDGGAPRLIPCKNSTIYGVLYEIDQPQWEILDQYEMGWGFRAIELEVETESGERVSARVHNLVDYGPFKAPSEQFIETMRKGYYELGYSDAIIARAVEAMTEPDENFVE